MNTDLLPFLTTSDPDAIVVSSGERAITAQQMVSDIYALAERLPEQEFLVNACQDRYRFVVGLGAALVRQQLSVLPHSYSPDTVRVIIEKYGQIACLVDKKNPFEGLRALPYPHDMVATARWPAPAFAADQPGACLSTSGSTGVPAWHSRSWGAIAKSAVAGANALGMTGDATWSVLATVPSQHSYGFESAIFLPLRINGRFHRDQPFYPADVMTALASMPGPRLLVTTPVHLRAMVSSTVKPEPADIVLSATAPLSEELAKQAEHFFRAPVMEIFGSTESGQTATRRTLDGDLWTPMQGVRFFSGSDNRFYADSHIGDAIELADRLDIESDGRFRLIGRQSDMLIVAGKRGSKTFVESHLLAIEGVQDAAVFNDERENSRGRIIGFVVAPGLARADILKQLRGSVDAAFVPRPLYFVDRLPRNETGKLTSQALSVLAANAEQDD